MRLVLALIRIRYTLNRCVKGITHTVSRVGRMLLLSAPTWHLTQQSPGISFDRTDEQQTGLEIRPHTLVQSRNRLPPKNPSKWVLQF